MIHGAAVTPPQRALPDLIEAVFTGSGHPLGTRSIRSGGSSPRGADPGRVARQVGERTERLTSDDDADLVERALEELDGVVGPVRALAGAGRRRGCRAQVHRGRREQVADALEAAASSPAR